MSLEKERIRVDYTREGVPASVQNFRPDIYRDGDVFYCVLGAPPSDNVIAKGATMEEAMLNWDIAYHQKEGK
ncbi:hypothetical protein SAMN05421788_110212 [Filimonas lacunae]|uniref:Uncharacterized protein n=1 Tax=Filimonas lacunae TaxID=477680 RepID=A0A173MAA6_9BACT|nr:hypothetical protein [Filimonas lacunae]BAV04475.1 hypothetical protein FLA_0467 [Filimonas lacunae]SIT31527.1 hypothetical protein SAMN05421788_110212 [Filimonas lacunae]